MPKDDRGEPIQLHTAAYNGEADLLSSYITQGGDLEVCACRRMCTLMLLVGTKSWRRKEGFFVVL